MSRPPKNKSEISRAFRALQSELGIPPKTIALITSVQAQHVHSWKSGKSGISQDKWDRLLKFMLYRYGIIEEDLLAADVAGRLRNISMKFRLEPTTAPDPSLPFPRDPTGEFRATEIFQPTGPDARHPFLHIRLSDDLPRAKGSPPYTLPEDAVAHLLGPGDLPPLPTDGLRRLALDEHLSRQIGLRRVEVAMLARLDLPEWASTPEILYQVLLSYREAFAKGDLTEKPISRRIGPGEKAV